MDETECSYEQSYDGRRSALGERFLGIIDQRTPANLDLHLVVDNYATHKHLAVKDWLTAHPRFHLHFTPTSSSWLNLVERFFAEITRKRIVSDSPPPHSGAILA